MENATGNAGQMDALLDAYEAYKAKNLKLNMARGKPAADQLDLSMPMLDGVASSDNLVVDGTDLRNYGVLDGIAEAKALMAQLLDDVPERTVIYGNASLNLMYDTIARAMIFGVLGSKPWGKLDEVRWICPSPGYDRHFAMTEAFGFTMLPVAMGPDGPDMDEVERLAASDSRVKGIWCVPKYANPSGCTYSDEVVRRLAAMECAADDFRIFWDNAYCVHHLFDDPEQQDRLLDIAAACEEAGSPDRYCKFASTSKITFPGAGISAVAASEANIAETKRLMGFQTIGHDKLNQLRHVRFLRDMDGIREHMAKQAAIIRPKFQLVLDKLEAAFGPDAPAAWANAGWTRPRGGYFVLFRGADGTAKRTVQLAREAGVVLTDAGAAWPYGNDPHDADIRIAPTLPTLDELDQAMDVFVVCAQIAALEAAAAE